MNLSESIVFCTVLHPTITLFRNWQADMNRAPLGCRHLGEPRGRSVAVGGLPAVSDRRNVHGRCALSFWEERQTSASCCPASLHGDVAMKIVWTPDIRTASLTINLDDVGEQQTDR